MILPFPSLTLPRGVFPGLSTRSPIAFGMSMGLHALIAMALVNMGGADYTPPNPTASFEVVDLSALMREPVPVAMPVKPVKAEVLPEPEPVLDPTPSVEKNEVAVIEEPVVPPAVEEALPAPAVKIMTSSKPAVDFPKVVLKRKPRPPETKKVQTTAVERLAPRPSPLPVTTELAAKPTQPSPPAPSYVPPTARAAYLQNPKPFYPTQARKRGMEGLVVLAVKVGVNGSAKSVSVKRSSGFPLLDRAARKSVSKWRFVPAKRNGRAVAAMVEVPIRYRLKDA